MNDYSLLNNRKIFDILIGDTPVYEDYRLPYLSGPQLCELSTTFGLSKTYTWKGSNQSRWEYMKDLLEYLNPIGKVPDLLTYLFQIQRFDDLTKLGDATAVHYKYKAVVDGAISSINANLTLAGKELRIVNKSFVVADIGQEIVFETPKVKEVTSQYIRELPDRINGDLEKEDYDSVITKSRTLLEEVLIYIIENLKSGSYKSTGDLNKIYQDTTALLNMRQQSDWDKRVNELLGGVHKIINAISSMRNINSDSHGAGSGRIKIKKREALLVANSSMMIAEFLLSVYEKKDA